jgi:hypothetical protein
MTEDRTNELHGLAVHRSLTPEEAMRLLGQRPAGMVGYLRQLPADLPEIRQILRLDARSQGPVMVNSMATRREWRLHDLGGKP